MRDRTTPNNHTLKAKEILIENELKKSFNKIHFGNVRKLKDKNYAITKRKQNYSHKRDITSSIKSMYFFH